MVCFTHRIAQQRGVVCAGLLPLWSLFFEKTIVTDVGTIHLPLTDMVGISSCLVSASLVGVFVARRFPHFYYKLWHNYLPSLTLLTLVASLTVSVFIHRSVLRQTTLNTVLFVAVICAAGYGSTLMVAYLARLKHTQQLTVCLETATRTSYIVGVMLHSSLAEPEAELSCLAPVTYSLLSVSVSTVTACVCRAVGRWRSSRSVHVEARCQLLVMSDDVPDSDHCRLETTLAHTQSESLLQTNLQL